MFENVNYTETAKENISLVKEHYPEDLKEYQNALDNYIYSIQLLMRTVELESGSSEVAAQLLLSVYNANEFHLSVCDLCTLDGEGREAAFAVMNGRINLSIEPHKLVHGGEEYFANLWHKYDYLHISKRYK